MQTLRRTPLHDRHVALGARMVPFAGWEMPVQYEGVIPEHRAVRTDAGVFDVSHMGELEVEGPTAQELRGSDVRDVSDEYGLLAVQGPRALERLGLAEAKAFTWQMGRLDDVEVMVNHTGYTGERGVELACMAEDAP